MTNPQFYKSAIDATGCISNAWNLIQPNYWLFFGISFVAFLIMFAVSLIPFIGGAVTALLTPPIMGGVYYVSLRAMRGEPVDFGMMFKGFEKAGPLLIIGAISSAPIWPSTVNSPVPDSDQLIVFSMEKSILSSKRLARPARFS